MPAFAGLLALCLLLIIGYTFSIANKAVKKGLEQDTQQKALAEQMKTVQEHLGILEKRLGNVEMILTDSQFIDPPTSGREAIDLKSEINELKSIIKNLK
ncbi:MAG: ATP-dependent Lon protease [Aureispira sp.]|jgi:ATP-dependent Lon protease